MTLVKGEKCALRNRDNELYVYNDIHKTRLHITLREIISPLCLSLSLFHFESLFS